MAVRDPAWAIFANEIKMWMDRRKMTAPDLCKRLESLGFNDIDPQKVNNWRKGHAPLLSELPLIVEALGMNSDGGSGTEPNYLAEQMGIIAPPPATDEVIDMAYRLQQLRSKYLRVQADAAQHGMEFGAAAITKAAVSSRRWAVAVWPAVEGPQDCRLHVSDRIDIRKNSPELDLSLEPETIWADEEMKAALRLAYAIPATRGPRWAYRTPGVTSWSISHVGTPMSPTVTHTHPGFVSVGFFGLTVDTWVNDVASLTATVLGYGLETTRDLAMEVHGIEDGQTQPRHRDPMHRWFLNHTPEWMAWSHYSTSREAAGRLFMGDDGQDKRVMHVWLKEDKDVLEDWVSFAKRTPAITAEELVRRQDEIERAISEMDDPTRVLTFPVRHCGKKNVTARWNQVLETVLEITSELQRRNFLSPSILAPAQMRMLAQRRHIAQPLYRWLVDRNSEVIKVPVEYLQTG